MSSPSIPRALCLPTELTEHILIFTATASFPTAIAALAQTCRHFHAVVYKSPDQHLWREVFLATFDDPRDTDHDHERPREYPQISADNSFDWGAEFRRRIWSANYIRASTKPTAPAPDSPAAAARDIVALESLLAVVHSARPCPPTLVFSLAPPAGIKPLPGADVGASLTSMPAYPVFPPHPAAAADDPRSSTCVAADPAAAVGHPASRNVPWFEAVLARGLPPALAAILSGTEWPGGLAGHLRSEHDARRMQALGRVVAYTGFLPVPQPPADEPRKRRRREAPGADGAEDMSEDAQHRRARRLARMRAYNMRYLSAARHWGPYLPAAAGAAEDGALLNPILEQFMRTGDISPPELQLVSTAGQGYASASEDEEEDEGGEEDEEEGDSDSSEEHGQRRLPLPPATALRADWLYLAAARVVVEANLREAVPREELSGLVWLDGLRRGSAPVDTGGARGARDDAAECWAAERPAAPPPGPGPAARAETGMDEPVDGWDWAGVTGVWRRCVCWMDYQQLILHNLSSEFDHRLQEAVRIVPMRLRAAWYSPSPVPAFPHRPTIHVEGETSGGGPGAVRRIAGTVSVIADGSVRWSLHSTVDGGAEDEWVTEGVQVGGRTTAMGVLGMWTGGQHERMDPLGPFWAWKVG